MINEILKNAPSWAIGFSILLVAIGIFINFFKKNINISTKGISITKNDINKIMLIVKNIMDIQKKIMQIELIYCRREQMRYVEDKIILMREKNNSAIYGLLKLKGLTDEEIKNNAVYRNFCNIIEKIIFLQKEIMRNKFQEIKEMFFMNNESDVLKYDQENYIKSQIILLVHKAQDQLRENWIDNELISTQTVNEEMRKSVVHNEVFYYQMLENAFNVQIHFNKQIEKLENELNEKINIIINKDK